MYLYTVKCIFSYRQTFFFLSFSAHFVPAEGQFTKVGNIGDVNVTVEFAQVMSSYTERKAWRLNGTADSSDYIRLDEAPPSYSITGGLRPEDGGVYEIQLSHHRAEGRGGLLRLIVRGNYVVENLLKDIFIHPGNADPGGGHFRYRRW